MLIAALGGCDQAKSVQTKAVQASASWKIPDQANAAVDTAKVEPAKPIAGILPGIYSNVRKDETGKLTGMEIEIRPGADHLIDTTICNITCSLIYTTTYTAGGDGLEYVFDEITRSDSGAPVGEIFTKLRIIAKGDEVVINDAVTRWIDNVALKRVPVRDGLARARVIVDQTAQTDR